MFLDKNEKIIIEKIKTGNVPAFEQLFNDNYTSLCLTARKYVTDLNLAEEVVQNLFMDLWKKREQLHVNTSIKAYLHKATINKSIDFVRKRKRDLQHLSFPEEITESPSTTNIQEQIEASELEEQIIAAITLLPPKCQIIFKMSRYEEKTYKEIAAQLNISQKAVEKQITKALISLRKAIKK